MATRATIILPTFGEAPFIRWAIASAQRQTVRELEICVICDGSPPPMIEMLHDLAREDPRIRVFTFHKGPRHGEIYRHEVITREATGAIICYLCHDDLYLPWHVESMERALQQNDFANSIAVAVRTQREGGQKRPGIQAVTIADLQEPLFRRIMLDWEANKWGFGLIFGAHTREAYLSLPEGWTTTPSGVPTDMFMWRKLIANAGEKCASLMEITALHFDRSSARPNWSIQEREAEIGWWFPLTQRPDFRETITSLAWRWVARDSAQVKGLGAYRPPTQASRVMTRATGGIPPAEQTGSARPTPAWRLLFDMWRVWRSGLFDREWYERQYVDIRVRRVNPLWHFVRWGAVEGRSPGPAFNCREYRTAHPEMPTGVNPLIHYLSSRGEGVSHEQPVEPRAERGKNR